MSYEQFDWSKITDRTVDFIKDQILAHEKAHDEASKLLSVQTRQNTSVLILSGTTLIGFGTNAMSDNLSAIALGSLVMGIYLLGCVWFLLGRVMKMSSFPAVGNTPDNLITEEFLSEKSENEVIIAELLGKQCQIDRMERKNRRQAWRINDAMEKALLSPLPFFITFLWAVLAGVEVA